MSPSSAKELLIMNSPKLRFKNFNDEWISTKIEKVCEICYGKSQVNIECKNGKYNILGTGGIIGTTNHFLYNKPSVLIGRKGTIDKPKFIDIPFWTVDTLFYTKINDNIIKPKFFYYCISHIDLKKYNEATGVPSLSTSILNKINIFIPSLEEQTKISNFLSLIDRKIELQEKLVENLKLYKKGLLQKIFKDECQNVPLSNLLIEKNNKNSIGLEVCSVAVEKGVVNQVEHLGRSFSAKDTSKYNRVSYGNLVYTKSPTGLFPYGIIKQSYKKNDVAVSPLYAIYNPITFNVGVLIHSFFEYPINTNNYLHSLIQKGAKNTINISNSRFLEKSIPMPNDNSLIDKYANLIIDINDKISYETKKLQNLKTYKKGLLQQMFI